MPSEEPRPDRCGAECRSGGYCESYPIEGAERCRMHGGTTPTKDEDPNVGQGAPANNGNAAKHNLYSDRDKLYQRLPEAEQDHVDSLAASFYDRYTDVHGKEPDYAATQRLKNVAMDVHKETLADNYAAEQSEEDDTHPLIQKQIIGQTEEGRPIEVEQPNQLIGIASGLKTDTRMWLKDLGLLDDPESQKADALNDLSNGARLVFTGSEDAE